VTGGGLAALADASLERLGDHVPLVFEGVEHTAARLHDRATRCAAGLRPRELHVVDAVPLTSVGKTDRSARPTARRAAPHRRR
jgi:acyl-CoA synthetase (AMP-forming)/AMP-acid ligase II